MPTTEAINTIMSVDDAAYSPNGSGCGRHAAARIEREPERCDAETSDGGQEQEAGGADGERVRERLDDLAVGEWGSRRSVGGEGGDREGKSLLTSSMNPPETR